MTEKYKLSKFTNQGLREFEIFVSNPSSVPNFAGLVVPISKVEIEKRIFNSKMEFAEYITLKLGEVVETTPRLKGRLSDPGMWAWLSYIYIDQIAPITDGVHDVGDAYRYLPDSDWRYEIRHLLRGSYLLYKRYQNLSRIFLCNPVNELGDFTEQIASRRDIALCKPLIVVIDRLYWDSDRNYFKVGSGTAGKSGTLRRLIKVIQQLGVNYDFHEMSEEQIIELIPDEFDRFLNE